MAVTIASLAAKLFLDAKGFVAGFAGAGKAVQGFGQKVSGWLSPSVVQMGAAVAGAVSLHAAMNALNHSMTNIDRNAKLADRLGITYQSMQKISLAANLAGADTETLAKAMLKMGTTIGSGGKPLDERFFDVADSLAAISDAGERASMARNIFGRGGDELLNLFMAGGKGIRDSAEAIDRLGLGINRIDAAKVEAANDAWEVMKAAISGIADQIAVGLAPIVKMFADDAAASLGRVNSALREARFEWALLGETIKVAYDVFKATSPLLILGRSATSGTPELAKVPEKFMKDLESLKKTRLDLGNAMGGAMLSTAMPSASPTGTAVRGSIEAASLIQKTGGDPISMLPPLLQEVIRQLKKIDGNTDENQKTARGSKVLAVAEF